MERKEEKGGAHHREGEAKSGQSFICRLLVVDVTSNGEEEEGYDDTRRRRFEHRKNLDKSNDPSFLHWPHSSRRTGCFLRDTETIERDDRVTCPADRYAGR